MVTPESVELRTCLNCDTPLQGEYCHTCGQRSGAPLPTLLDCLASGVTAVTDLDGPLWNSLRKLVTRPGTLSSDFIAGRGASCVHPVKLFVAVAVLALVPRAFVQSDPELGGIVYIITAGLATAIGQEWAQVLTLLVAVPLMAGALKILYLRRGRRFLEHVVVTTEFFALVLLVGTVETLVVLLAGGGSAQSYTALVAVGFLAWGAATTLRRAYGSTVWESIVGVVYMAVWAGTGILLSLGLL